MKDLLEQLHQLAPLAEAATPGEWQQSHRKGAHGMYSTQVYDVYGATIASMAWHEKPLDDGSIGTYREDNAAFIAYTRNLLTPENLLALCAALAANNTNQKAMDSLRTLLCGVGVVGEVDGHAVIRRASVIELVDQMRHV